MIGSRWPDPCDQPEVQDVGDPGAEHAECDRGTPVAQAGRDVGPRGDRKRQQQRRGRGLAAGGDGERPHIAEVALCHVRREAVADRRHKRGCHRPMTGAAAKADSRAGQPQHAGEADRHADPLQRRQSFAQPEPGHQCSKQRRSRVQDRRQSRGDRQHGPGEKSERNRGVHRAEQHETQRPHTECRKVAAQREQWQQHQRSHRDAQFCNRQRTECRHGHAREQKARTPERGEQHQVENIASFHGRIFAAAGDSSTPLLAVITAIW